MIDKEEAKKELDEVISRVSAIDAQIRELENSKIELLRRAALLQGDIERASLHEMQESASSAVEGVFLTVPQIVQITGRKESSVRSALSRKGYRKDPEASARMGEPAYPASAVSTLFHMGRKLPDRRAVG